MYVTDDGVNAVGTALVTPARLVMLADESDDSEMLLLAGEMDESNAVTLDGARVDNWETGGNENEVEPVLVGMLESALTPATVSLRAEIAPALEAKM